MIFVILRNTEMCNVHMSMILEGLEYCILCTKAFGKVTPKAGKLSPYAFSYGMHFDVLSILWVCLPWVHVHSAICEWNLIWCSGMYIDLCSIGGLGPWYMCIFYMWNLFGLVVLYRFMVNWRGEHLSWVYVHSTIC